MCETKRFSIYEKSSGRYLGHATVTANLNGEDLLVENLKFGPALKEEYFEGDEEVEQKYLEIKRDLDLSDQGEEFPDDDDVTQEVPSESPSPALRRSGRTVIPNTLFPPSEYDLRRTRSRRPDKGLSDTSICSCQTK